MSKLVRMFLSIFVLALGLCSSMLPAVAQQAGQAFSQRIGGNSASSAGTSTLSPFTTQQSSGNWSGWEVGSGAGNGFEAVIGEWNAECVSGPNDSHHQFGSWVGLGGDFNQSLEQTGIILRTDGTYRMFWEYVYPDNTGPAPTIDTTDVVKCGQHIKAWVHLGSAYCPNGGWDTYIQDTTTGKFLNHACDASKPLGYESAEWIDERPLVGCGLTQLADFNYTSWSDVQAQAKASGAVFHGPNSFANTRLAMQDYQGGPYLAFPDATVSSNNTFTDRWYGAGTYC
ncbi:MAG TPA: G1 family glutamic endopeptidase [Ktedonobacterales bacterium]|jgi:hypothetical protein